MKPPTPTKFESQAYIKIASEMPIPHSLGKHFSTMIYRSAVSVQSSGYFQGTVSDIKIQTMFKEKIMSKRKIMHALSQHLTWHGGANFSTLRANFCDFLK